MPTIQIAIDGPAGAGKSTIAKAVAKKLDILYLDTGAMYRALALFAFSRGVDPNDGPAAVALLPEAEITVRYENGGQRTLLNGRDVSDEIRTPAISKGASDISVHPPVRVRLAELQRQVARETDVVMDGREIGTFVLPDAPHKFFVTASPRIRAQRRLLEMQARGEEADLDELEAAILARDHRDSTREFAPLRQAEDAVVLDTTELTIDEAVNAVLSALGGKEG